MARRLTDSFTGRLATTVNDVPDAFELVRMSQSGPGDDDDSPRRKIVAIILAHPRHRFAAINIFPHIGQWNTRSKNYLLILFPGFQRRLTDTASDEALESFSEVSFNSVVEWCESNIEDFVYSGRTMVVLFSTQPLVSTAMRASPLDNTAIVSFDLEQLVEERVFEESRVFFESLIALAKAHPGDDPLWELKDNVVNAHTESAIVNTILGTLEKYIKIPDSFRASVRARRALRVRRGV